MTTQSQAYTKVEKYRDAAHKGQQKVKAKDLTSVVYIFTNQQGKPCAVGYRGRATNPAFRNYYASEENRAKHINGFMANCSKNKAERAKHKKRELEVGDVLYSSWGYDQTNIDFYMVVSLVGSASVELVEIGQIKEYGGQDYGQCWPDKSKINSDPFKKRANGDHVKIASYAYARKIEPVDGSGDNPKDYPVKSWSSWH